MKCLPLEAIAMESRCYNGSEDRFKFKVLKFNIREHLTFAKDTS